MTTFNHCVRKDALAAWANALEASHKEINRLMRGGVRDSDREGELRLALEVARIRLETLGPA